MDSLDNNVDSTLIIKDFEIKQGSDHTEGKTVSGTIYDDVLVGGDLNDKLYGDSGKDSLTGGANNDFIDGGGDTDTAYYTGGLEEYSLVYNWDSKILYVSDNNSTRDGNDTLASIELINFGGKLYNISSLEAYQNALNDASRDKGNNNQPASPPPSKPEPTPTEPEPTPTEPAPIPKQELPEWLSKHYLSNSSIIKSQANGKKGKKAFADGNAGDNVLIAGKGKKDVLTGNSGADLFAITSRKKKEKDIITDFNRNEGDKIGISSNALKGLGSINFTIANNKKELKALLKEDFNLIYLSSSGKLFYDQNGSGKGFGKAGGMFAQLSGNPEILGEDFTII
jgi:Ca2+-binding RTX toxin-like protein